MLKRALLILIAVAAVSVAASLVAAGEERPEGPRRTPEAATRPHPALAALTKEQEQELLAFLKARRPAQYEKLIGARDSNPPNPQRYQFFLHGAWGWYQRMKAMPKELQDVEIANQELKVKVWQLCHDVVRATDPQEKQKVTGRLEEALTQQFEAEQKLSEYRLGRMEEEIQKLRAEMKERAEQREKIIHERASAWIKAASQPATQPGRRGPGQPGEREHMPRDHDDER